MSCPRRRASGNALVFATATGRGLLDRPVKPGDDKRRDPLYTEPTPRIDSAVRKFPVLDIKWIRDNPDAFLKGLTDRGFDDPTATLNRILSLDEQRRTTIQKLQEAQARRNAASKEIGQAKASKDEAAAKRLMDEVAALKTAIQDGEAGRARGSTTSSARSARHDPQHAGLRRAGRRRCRRQCRIAQIRHAAEIRVPAEAAFRDRRRRSA